MRNCFYFLYELLSIQSLYRPYSLLWIRLTGMSVQSYEEWSFFSVVSPLGPFPKVFRQVREWLILESHKMIRVPHEVACPIYFILCLRWARRSVQICGKWSLFSISSRLGTILHLFGKVKERLILELHEMITVSYAVAVALDLNLLCDWGP